MHRQTVETRNNRMEDITFRNSIVCDRCGKDRPEGSRGLGWLTGMMGEDGKWDWYGHDVTAREVDICPDCFRSDEETERAEEQVSQYIHFNLARRSRLLQDINGRFLSDRESFLQDCGTVSRLMKTCRRYRRHKFYRSCYAGKSMALSKDVHEFLKNSGKPLSDDGMKFILENDGGQVMFIDGDGRRVFVANNREDILVLYWHARNKARMHTRNPLRFRLQDISSPNERIANGWKAVARYARQKIKQGSISRRSPAKGLHVMFTRIPANLPGTTFSP